MNKEINGKQCTVLWHIDDIMLSHEDQAVLEMIAEQANDRYGKEAPLTVHHGTIHDYLGMTIDYSEDGKVKFIMQDYVEGILEESPEEFDGTAVSPAAEKLFTINEDAERLEIKKAEKFHRLAAKCLYLSKRAPPDIQPTVSHLVTRVTRPDVDDWKKLGQCIRYLRETKHYWLTLKVGGAGGTLKIKWWVDASFAVHPDMRSHTGATMTLGKGSPFSLSTKQKLNTQELDRS